MPLHRLARTLGNLLGSRSTPRPQQRRPRLELLILEDRSLLTVSASGVLTGLAFVDANANGVREAQESLLPGVEVRLSGRSNAGEAISATAVTGANGAFFFARIAPGTYSVRGEADNFLGNTDTITTPNGATGVTVVTTPTFTGAQVKSVQLGFRGLASQAVSLASFLASTPAVDTAVFSPPGTGSPTTGYLTNRGPSVRTGIANVNVTRTTTTTSIDLAANFADADTTNTLIRFNTSAGAINAELYDSRTPQTVANFLNYIQSNRFDNTIFHRHIANFVLQGGGFEFETNPSRLPEVVEDPQVRNEPVFSNLVNTLAMAKLPNLPNSASSQFFVNLGNNSGTLDNQNGGFTVFGELIGPADRAVVNTVTALPVRNMTSSAKPENSAFDTIPLNNYNGTAATFPTDTVASNFAMVNDVVVVQRSEVLTYSVVSNSNTGLVTTAITNNRLRLNYVGNQVGAAVIVVRATDRFGESVDTSFTVRRTA